jgi:hypothetical protein
MSKPTRLEDMNVAELEEVAAKLRHTIERSPRDTRMEQIELKDVDTWIALRQKEALEGSTEAS